MKRTMAVAFVLGAVGCTESHPCDEPGACVAEPVRPVGFVAAEGAAGPFRSPGGSALAQLGAVEFQLVDPDSGDPFLPPFQADLDNATDFSLTMTGTSSVRIESTTFDAQQSRETVLRIRTTDRRILGSQPISATAPAPPRITALGESDDFGNRLIALSAGVRADLLVTLPGSGGPLYDETMTVTVAGAVSSTPLAWDGVRVQPPATGAITVTATAGGIGTVPTTIPISAGAVSILEGPPRSVSAGRPAMVCAAALDTESRQVVGLRWTWTVADGPAQVSPPLADYPTCITVAGSQEGVVHLTASVPGATGTITVNVSPPGV